MSGGVRVVCALALASLSVACVPGDDGPAPEEQYREVVTHLKAGQFVAAYETLLPASYRADLDAVIAKLPQLVDEEAFAVARERIRSAGLQLASDLALLDDADGSLGKVAEALQDLPALLGVSTYVEFQKLDARSVVGALETGILRTIVTNPQVKSHLASVEVAPVDRKNDWARLRFSIEPTSGPSRSELIDFIRVGDRWIIDAWVSDWPSTMEGLRRQLDVAIALKKETPEEFDELWDALLAKAENPMVLIQGIAAKIGLMPAAPAGDPAG